MIRNCLIINTELYIIILLKIKLNKLKLKIKLFKLEVLCYIMTEYNVINSTFSLV